MKRTKEERWRDRLHNTLDREWERYLRELYENYTPNPGANEEDEAHEVSNCVIKKSALAARK